MINFKPRGNRRDNRIRHVYYPAESGTMVKLEIHHRDGGMNYFSGGTEKRGIEISISTVEVKQNGGVSVESFEPFNGANGRLLLVETARYSANKLEQVAATLDPLAPEISAAWARDHAAAIAMITGAMEQSRLAA